MMGIFDGTSLESMIPEDKRGHKGLSRDMQPIRVLRVKVRGKWHSRVEGFDPNATDTNVKELCAQARKRFACAGKAQQQDALFELHGDHAEALIGWLKEQGFRAKRAGG